VLARSRPNLRCKAWGWCNKLKTSCESSAVETSFDIAARTACGKRLVSVCIKCIPNGGSSYRRTMIPKRVRTRVTDSKLQMFRDLFIWYFYDVYRPDVQG